MSTFARTAAMSNIPNGAGSIALVSDASGKTTTRNLIDLAVRQHGDESFLLFGMNGAHWETLYADRNGPPQREGGQLSRAAQLKTPTAGSTRYARRAFDEIGQHCLAVNAGGVLFCVLLIGGAPYRE